MKRAAEALLEALLAGGRGYSLELIARVREHTKGAVVLTQLTVYPALRQLEDDGLAWSWDGEPLAERGGRPRRYYELTSKGRALAQKMSST